MKNINKYILPLIILLFSIQLLDSREVLTQDITSGESQYEEFCSDCHSLTLRGTAHGSSLIGKQFIEKWEKIGFHSLLDYTKESMPPGQQGLLSDKSYKEIHNYILASNNKKTDDSWVAFSDPSTIDQPNERKTNFKNKVIRSFKNISTEDINNPPSSDWLSWRRTIDGQGFSPLKIINTENIKDLKLSWSLSMNE